jgi:hypothetical protein
MSAFRPTPRFDVETLASLTVREIEDTLSTIEQWANRHPEDRALDSAWRAYRNEWDYRRSQRS